MTISNSNQPQNTQLHSSWNFSNKFLLFLAGGGIGAAAALLFAPKSGNELRTDISEITKKGYEETLELAHHLKEQSADFYNSLKEKTENVYDLAATKLLRNELASEIINGEMVHDKNDGSLKKTAGRRSSNIV